MTPIQQAVLEEYICELKEATKPVQMKGRNYGYGICLEKQRSYQLWAANDIYTECVANIDESPVYIVERYRDLMVMYASKKTSKFSYMFAVASDVAEDMLDCLCAL